ncbi:MAG: HNH endonuclease, partial [Proteobacteria bacterium]|nr:HNH endonuclease [Pseudomonadota bacterium]
KIPKALGGTNDLENLQWVETNVNRAKNALAEDEFLSMCRAVVQHMERNRGAVRPL